MGTLSVMSSKGMSEGEEMDMDTLDVTSVQGTDSTEHPHKLKTVKSMSDGVADDIKADCIKLSYILLAHLPHTTET
ncbi:hypothetical protein SARC_08614 [Sphaeroforma arctica JP610]|uniref:Uncharacterized protein n=1 Tax=Sphaeroforma arctica JP610 TaxID=667725 RepID=A0A0L0FQA9_9EUKA|nr:hypothetical protein SARC_08614 [Sphaeroforma arctica JP610]KNC78975.1 hypothetical protein SARC_08614 [Sphaeroforma arctica JP610]|eukprot:XP_014152877.1 hypothetical protein SARC_08614 [Sphaeroforma arctica JP610]